MYTWDRIFQSAVPSLSARCNDICSCPGELPNVAEASLPWYLSYLRRCQEASSVATVLLELERSKNMALSLATTPSSKKCTKILSVTSIIPVGVTFFVTDQSIKVNTTFSVVHGKTKHISLWRLSQVALDLLIIMTCALARITMSNESFVFKSACK